MIKPVPGGGNHAARNRGLERISRLPAVLFF